MAPKLFRMFSVMLMDSQVIQSKKLARKITVRTVVLDELLYTCDMEKNASSEGNRTSFTIM